MNSSAGYYSMPKKLFGTDGIRGTANIYPMTPDMAMKIGIAAGKATMRGKHRHTVIIGKDTRLSGYIFEPALTAGFISFGMDVILVGPLPTPAVAMLTRSLRADLGVMISASHNPYEDNGIKLFGPDGYKLPDRIETEIESIITNGTHDLLADPKKIGRAKRLEDSTGRYIEFAKSTFPKGLRLDGLKIVIDCANGASYRTAPLVLWELGAEVIRLGDNPNGFNINHGCGSTDTALMQKTILEVGADIGIALDGDADRVIMADEKGRILDGDQLIGAIANALNSNGNLEGGGIVTTIMSNLGLERYINDLGLEMLRTDVGDRHVLEAMLKSGMNVGGEQSGHIILGDHNTTGDGLVAALQVLALLKKEGRPASEVCSVFEPLPQILHNIPFKGLNPMASGDFEALRSYGEQRLGLTGFLSIRQSGTEPVIRIMGQGEDKNLLKLVVDEVCSRVRRQVRQ